MSDVFDCATPRPRLAKVRDPFARLLSKAKGSVVIPEFEILSAGNGRGKRMNGSAGWRKFECLHRGLVDDCTVEDNSGTVPILLAEGGTDETG